jgi:transposase
MLCDFASRGTAACCRYPILVSAFYILVRHEPYRELGATYFDRLRHSQSVERLTRRLEQLGYAVHLEPRPAAA